MRLMLRRQVRLGIMESISNLPGSRKRGRMIILNQATISHVDFLLFHVIGIERSLARKDWR